MIGQIASTDDDLTAEELCQQFDSVVWFRDRRNAGDLKSYEGRYLAVQACHILDSDVDNSVLIDRIAAVKERAIRRTTAIQYVPHPNEWVLR